MRLHYNPECIHNNLPTAQLRLLYNAGRFAEVLQETERLDALPLEERQPLVTRTHTVMAKLALHRVGYERAKQILAEVAQGVAKIGDENYIAEFRARRLAVARKYGDHELADYLTNTFFAGIGRTPITEAHWRIGQGSAYRHQKGPGAAIPFYQTVVMQLRDAKRPCLREGAARHLAYCVSALGNKDGAVSVLRNVGLSASIEPGEGEIALADLLAIPLM